MIVTGIIVEYNPFHNGHIKHIKLAREKTNCDVVVAVMSGNFAQRGHPTIFDKYERVKAALLNDVDLIIELPFVLANQSATVFADSAVKLLQLAKCDYIVFGSELNDLEALETYSNININPDNLKEQMSDGTSYPKAYSILSREFFPNDILAISYLKALKETDIKPIIIKRDNNFNDQTISIKSATSIRNDIQHNIKVNDYTPMHDYDDHAVFMSDYFNLIKTTLLTCPSETLSTYALFAEGIENNLIKQAMSSYSYDEFIQKCISRRYTRARINRTLMFMLTHITQKELDNLPELLELRVLGFNDVGQTYIRQLLDEDVKVVSKFKHLNKTYRELELRSTAVYISALSSDRQEYLWNKEFRGPIILRNDKFYNV